jgi:hypothetical protein
MHATIQAAHPFAMLTDPEATMRAIEESHRISAHRGRICRPLDRQQIPRDDAADSHALDEQAERDEAPLADE